jgi:hypothetical protein
VSTRIDDQLQQHLRTLAEVAVPVPDEIEGDVRDRVTRRRRRRRAAPVLGGLAVAGLAVAVVTVVREDGPADVRVTDDTSTSASPGGGEPSLRIARLRVGRHDGADRVVVEFTTNLSDHEVTEVDDIATEAGFGPAFAVDDAPNYGECELTDLAVEGAAFVNVVVPSDWLLPDGPAGLEPRYSSSDTEIVGEVAVCGPYEGRAHLTIALSQPGEVDATILDDPGRVVLDIR